MRESIRQKGECGLAVAVVALLLATGCSPAQPPRTAQETTPASAMSAEDVQVSGVQLFREDDGVLVEGLVRNNSAEVTLGEFQFKMTMQDCLEDLSCQILAEDVVAVAVRVPPGESGPFKAAPDFSNMPAPKGQLSWRYAVTGATAAP